MEISVKASSQSVEVLDRYSIFQLVLDEHGLPRLKQARKEFLPLTQDRISLLNEVFSCWQDFNEYLLLRGKHRFIKNKKIWIAVKASKRGNDVYSNRIDKRLGFFSKIRNVLFFKPEDFKADKKVFSNLLWITLTYDSKRSSLHQAQLNCQKEFNRWITNLRNRYGKIDVLKFKQAFPDPQGEAYGYPHFHVVLFFADSKFQVFPNLEEQEDGSFSFVYRIQEKDELHNQGNWHSFTDIKALSSIGSCINYCRKYAQNVMSGDSEEARINNAVNWLYRSKSFSLSKNFQAHLIDLISSLRISKVQVDLFGNFVSEWIWSFHGLTSKIDSSAWVVELSEDELDNLVNNRGGLGIDEGGS